MKGSKIFTGIIIFILILLSGALIFCTAYLKQQSKRETYFPKTTINGHDVSEMTPQDALPVIEAEYLKTAAVLREDGEEAISGSLDEFGYVIDETKLKDSLTKALEKQKNSIPVLVQSLIEGSSFNVTIPYTFYAETLKEKVNAAALPKERVSSTNAKIKFRKKKQEYYIKSETYGNEFDDTSLQTYMQQQLETFISGNHPGETLTVDFPTDIYLLPEITSGDITLNTTVNIYNQFCKAKITHVFGSYTEVIDWDTIQDWISIVDGQGYIDDEKAYNYVISLAEKYNTRHYDRHFHTSIGTDIVIPSSENDYGYTINEDAEFDQLIADIRSNTEVEREPVYYQTSGEYGNPLFYRRDGKDDLAGNYVEVNLTQQHLWFYMDGALLVDTPIVSGSVAKKAETKTGTFALAYKESPSILRGSNAADGYETKVNYWMPFYEGQGLHDASWRASFGGNIYLTSGSHGCVNMPPYAAEIVYRNIQAGVAIIIYK